MCLGQGDTASYGGLDVTWAVGHQGPCSSLYFLSMHFEGHFFPQKEVNVLLIGILLMALELS